MMQWIFAAREISYVCIVIKGLLSRINQGHALTTGPWDGRRLDDPEMYWAQARAEFARRQLDMARIQGLAGATWHVDQNSGLIWFERRDGAVLKAPVQIVGSFNPKTAKFTWGWDHPSVHVRLRSAAEHTRWFGDKHDLASLVAPQVAADETEAWTYTALAWKLDGASAAYRGPLEGGPVLFMTLGDLKRG
jgi:hypothetical protein